MNKSVGITELKYYTFADQKNPLILSSGKNLWPVTLAYESYGQLNADKSNAILIEHAFSGDAHAAGFYPQQDRAGWWDIMIGPGKAFDTDKYFVICSNVIGGCSGSTGPSSINPHTGKPYALDFPLITIEDIVCAQKHLVQHLGIKKLFCVVGGSMGGMQVLQWVASFPEMVERVIPIAAALKHSPQQIAFNEVGRQAVMADPAWNKGYYYEKDFPLRGLAIARMIGHITYMSPESMEEKFARKLKEDKSDFSFAADFEIEGYLKYRGDNFVKRFDANSYLYITKAMDYFDLSDGQLFPKKSNFSHLRFLVIAFRSDWLYPPGQAKEIVRAVKQHGLHITYCEIDASYGHDTFLVEEEEQTRLISHFLKAKNRV